MGRIIFSILLMVLGVGKYPASSSCLGGFQPCDWLLEAAFRFGVRTSLRSSLPLSPGLGFALYLPEAVKTNESLISSSVLSVMYSCTRQSGTSPFLGLSYMMAWSGLSFFGKIDDRLNGGVMNGIRLDDRFGEIDI
jgi:hypothetical protein